MYLPNRNRRGRSRRPRRDTRHGQVVAQAKKREAHEKLVAGHFSRRRHQGLTLQRHRTGKVEIQLTTYADQRAEPHATEDAAVVENAGSRRASGGTTGRATSQIRDVEMRG